MKKFSRVIALAVLALAASPAVALFVGQGPHRGVFPPASSGGGGGGGSTIIHYDTFTEASNQTLATHTPETGSYADNGDRASLSVEATPDEMSPANNTREYYWEGAQPSNRSVTIAKSVKIGTTGTTAWSETFIRADVSDNYFRFRLDGSGVWNVWQANGGTEVLQASSTVAGFSTSSYYETRVSDSNTTNQLTFAIDGSVVWSNVDNDHTSNVFWFASERNTAVQVTSTTVTQN